MDDDAEEDEAEVNDDAEDDEAHETAWRESRTKALHESGVASGTASNSSLSTKGLARNITDSLLGDHPRVHPKG